MHRALAAPRPTPQVDLLSFLKNVGLDKIHGYSFVSALSGGGTNITALYASGNENVVAKFFFTGPTGAGDSHCDRELKMLSMVHSQETVLNIKVVPRVIEEFSSTDKMIVGFLMEHIQGESLADLIERIGPGKFHETIVTFTRIGWARHNAFRASISHKDLHPGNIIFELDNDEWERWIMQPQNDFDSRVRILDLGSAVMPMQFNYDESFDESWYRDLIRYFNGAFTCVAPEFFTRDFLRSLQGSQTFDCWALGNILYKIYTGKTIDIAHSVGDYCKSIYGNTLEFEIRSQINSNVDDHRMRFLIRSMLTPDHKKRISLFSAIAYANLLRQKHPKVSNLAGSDLYNFLYIQGADLEYGLPPHERSNSPY
jgi:serine/threonine protein kinase